MRPESAFLYTEKLEQIADEFTDLMFKLRDRMHEMPEDFLTYVRLFTMEGIGKSLSIYFIKRRYPVPLLTSKHLSNTGK
jgi:hypothetical protein